MTLDRLDLIAVIRQRLNAISHNMLFDPECTLTEIEEKIGEVQDLIAEFKAEESTNVG